MKGRGPFLSAAMGRADNDGSMPFQKADKAMYKNKKLVKEKHRIKDRFQLPIPDAEKEVGNAASNVAVFFFVHFLELCRIVAHVSKRNHASK